MVSCARMGNPDGGWFDETPPKITGSSPEDMATGITGNKVIINFDEYIKLDNPTEKIVVSPPQLEAPEIKGQGKRIVVELKDTLKENTTYTIDFSDAISDNNEGNPLGNYTFSFSTGDYIDTLEVSGMVVNAENLEPVKGILVGLFTNTADSAFQTEPMLRVSRTDSRGRFVIRGIAEGSYRIYALQDMDGNYMLSQRAEMLAFTDDIITPSCKPDIRQDTIWADSLRIKDIQRVGYTHFFPDNIVLRAFNQEVKDRAFLKYERKNPDNFTLFFSYGSDELPSLRGLNFDDFGAFIIEPSLKNDTITYWLRDTTLVNQDTLRMEMTYMMTDTLGMLVSNTDTLEVLPKVSYEKRLKQQERDYEDWKKKQDRAKKKGARYDSIMPIKHLEPEYSIPNVLDPDKNIIIRMPSPIEHIDTGAIHLYVNRDSTWYRANCQLRESKDSPRTYELLGEWRPGLEYSLEIDSLAFTDIYFKSSNKMKKGFKVGNMEDYCSLMLNISGLPDSIIADMVVELLNAQDNAIKTVKTKNNGAEIYYIKPGTYYVRAFIDSNGNGVWDTGEYANHLQPEYVYYYPEKIECKGNWDLRLPWNVTARSVDNQKPSEIIKQKPEQEKKIKQQNLQRARKLGIPPPL